MKIIINTNPEIENPEQSAFNNLKKWCDENFKRYSLEIENTEHKVERG